MDVPQALVAVAKVRLLKFLRKQESQTMEKLIVFILFSTLGFSQENLESLLQKQNNQNTPYITVKALSFIQNQVILLDAREKNEFLTSHLKNAIYAGYNSFNIDSIQQKITNKASQIVVYCSLGIRSEDIAEKLKKAGYKNVLNLYGGIFEWKNNNFPVYNSKNQPTDSIHAFSKTWSKWLKTGIKVYD